MPPSHLVIILGCFAIIIIYMKPLFFKSIVNDCEPLQLIAFDHRILSLFVCKIIYIYSLDPLAWAPLGPRASGSKLYKNRLFGQSGRTAWSMKERSWVSLTLWYHLPGWPNKHERFLKPFLKGTILRSGEWERGKFDFDHHFAFLTNFLKWQNFLLSGILFGSSRGSFSKKTDLPFRFQIGLRNAWFIFGRKNGRLFCFAATLSDFGLLF